MGWVGENWSSTGPQSTSLIGYSRLLPPAPAPFLDRQIKTFHHYFSLLPIPSEILVLIIEAILDL